MQPTSHDLLVRYLLGDLPASAREQVEQDYFASDDLWEALQQAETDLIDSYAAGKLSNAQREQFERFFLASPQRRKRLSIAQSLMGSAIRKELSSLPSQSSGSARLFSQGHHRRWVFLSAAAAVVLAAAVTVLWMQNHMLRLQLQSARAAPQGRQQAVNPLAVGRTTTETALMSSRVLLEPGLVRGGTGGLSQSVSAAESQSSMVLTLDLRQDKYPAYDVAVQTAKGSIVQRFTGLQSQSIPHGRIVSIEFRPRQLPIGEYVVKLFGSGQNLPVDSYMFSVSK